MLKLYGKFIPTHRQCLSIAVCVLLANFVTPEEAHAVQAQNGTLDVNGFLENASYYRKSRELSKSRTTGQLEFSKRFNSSVSFHSTFRATYDAVYRLNDEEFGKNAGGAIRLETSAGMTPNGPVAAGLFNHGAGIKLPAGGFDLTENPNMGLEVLGSHLHDPAGGVTFGVPVRPCNVDSRGCIDGYLDFDEGELASPEFNSRFDFIREAYFDFNISLQNGDQFDIRLGRQQVVWGRTDLFRVLDVINPVDFSRNNIYDELEDIRIPMGILNLEYRMGGVGSFEDLNFSLMWNWEKFRPNNLGQGGSPNAILDAGNFFRGMKNCWDNGCTVSNFAFGLQATDFPKHVLGIRSAKLPSWKLKNTQYGAKIEGVYKGIGFSLNALYYYSQLPSLRGGIPSDNPFTPAVEETVFPYMIAFDIEFPRIFLLGGSADFYIDSLKTAFRIEMAHTSGEEFANTLRPRLFSESNVLRYVIGADRNTFIPFLNKNRAFLFSAQIFGQHLLEHEIADRPLGQVGMPDWKNNWIFTLLIKGWYKNDRISPQVITAYDLGAKAAVVSPSVDWLINDNWRLMVVGNIKLGVGARRFDDCRTCNPFPPATATPAHPDANMPGSVGLGGFEPLGRFRQGPIGTAQNEDEIQFILRFRF